MDELNELLAIYTKKLEELNENYEENERYYMNAISQMAEEKQEIAKVKEKLYEIEKKIKYYSGFKKLTNPTPNEQKPS